MLVFAWFSITRFVFFGCTTCTLTSVKNSDLTNVPVVTSPMRRTYCPALQELLYSQEQLFELPVVKSASEDRTTDKDQIGEPHDS